MHDERSFGDLRDAFPALSDKVLADRLRQLVDDGLADRVRTPGFPSRVSYRLTPAGVALRPLLVELYRTGERVAATAGVVAPD